MTATLAAAQKRRNIPLIDYKKNPRLRLNNHSSTTRPLDKHSARKMAGSVPQSESSFMPLKDNVTDNVINSVISVSQLNRVVRLAIEKSFPSCWISGEISNFTRASSGHWYFTLKDEQCSVKCAYFRNKNQYLDWLPKEGNHVEVRAQATLYEPRGDYQLLIEAMRREGVGAIYEEFIKLKLKLETEGLFKAENKLAPPVYPKRIGIITSLQAAALQDVLKTLANRWPSSAIVIYPTSVQGAEAATMIRLALETAIKRAINASECDVLLLVRGGGSLEDLRPFNDEQLARSLHACPIPVISGIGHETDFSIADFVADLRAATPTAAAQLATPDRFDISKHVKKMHEQLTQSINRRIQQKMQQIDSLTRHLIHPGNAVKNMQQKVTQLQKNISFITMTKIVFKKQQLKNYHTQVAGNSPNLQSRREIVRNTSKQLNFHLIKRIETQRSAIQVHRDSLKKLNPINVMTRGYCIAFNDENKIIKGTGNLAINQKIELMFSAGRAGATVNKVIRGN